ncbi:hypothetical protein GU926_08320 [Nibribacter ruber]|uniref:Uncharacterized protein n=1 Tax=Nibribacter ruber TaxID=2698458 RepID=A0A6P1NZR4_9BACT|nr:hypothetical protein [Nibribacter ruber]QHL87441.1 hypothetical protein GU926_08320 [Nibribacter ruber]
METNQISTQKRNLIRNRALIIGDREQIKVIQDHNLRIQGIKPVAVPTKNGSRTAVLFNCLNNRCKKRNSYIFSQAFGEWYLFSKQLGRSILFRQELTSGTLSCACGHQYSFRNDLDGKLGLYSKQDEA